jgi:hypothetical protein
MSFELIDHYVQTLRKPAKKHYAIAYWRYLKGYTKVEPDKGELSSMGAQSIRIEIHSWFKHSDPVLEEIYNELAEIYSEIA